MNQDCPGPQDLESFIRRRLDDTQARRIEDHLSSCRSCRQRLEELSAEETLAGRLREALGRPDVRDVLEQLRAQVEGRYEILSLIGQGSCGAVFEARDLRLQKRVAIKCPLKSAQKQRLAEAFREARILARIHHPHVAQIYHLEDHPDRPFMVMEYVDGIAITEATGHLPWRQRLEPFRCCLDALAQMHREGIVHRDLKPQNILVDRQGHTKLVDLGIAEQQDRHLDEGILPAPVQGTPAYMAPEQIQGLPAGCGMDVFAMGVVLYELLTDQRPFGGASVAEVCRAIQSRDPILPRTLRAQIPGPLQAICLAALEKDPADRYPSAREFLLDLERFFQGEPVVANPPMLRAILAHGVDRHIQDLARWRQDRIISGREYDCLADRYDRLRQREEFWVLDSRRITGSQVLLHLGGWLCVLSTFLLLCPGLGWERLPRTARIALPVALFAVLLVLGQRLWRRRNRRIAMVMLIAAALIFPFAIANGLITMEWLAGARQAGGEYFSIGQSAPGGQLSSEDTPDNLLGSFLADNQLRLTAGLWLVLSGLIWWKTRTTAFSLIWGVSVLAAATALFSWFDLRRFWDEGQYETIAGWYFLPGAVLFALAVYLELYRRRMHLAGPLYILALLVFLLGLTVIAFCGPTNRWLGVAVELDEEYAVRYSLMANGVLYLILGLAADRSRRSRWLRRLAPVMLWLAPSHVLAPMYLLAQAGQGWACWGSWHLWELLLPAGALFFLFASVPKQMKSFFFSGLFYLALSAVQLSYGHFQDRFTWPIALAVTGLLLSLIAWRVPRWQREPNNAARVDLLPDDSPEDREFS